MRRFNKDKEDNREINLRFAGEILLMLISVYLLGVIPLVIAFSFFVPRRHKFLYAILIVIKLVILMMIMDGSIKSIFLGNFVFNQIHTK